MKPRFERVASDWGARARFFEVEYDKNKELCRDDLNLLALPTVQIYAGGAAGLLDTFSCGPSKVARRQAREPRSRWRPTARPTWRTPCSATAPRAPTLAEDAASAKDRPRAARSPEPSPAARRAGSRSPRRRPTERSSARGPRARARGALAAADRAVPLVRAAGPRSRGHDLPAALEAGGERAGAPARAARRGMMAEPQDGGRAKAIDSDNDGEVSMADLRNLMSCSGGRTSTRPTTSMTRRPRRRGCADLQSADADQNERIDLDEFVSLVARAGSRPHPRGLPRVRRRRLGPARRGRARARPARTRRGARRRRHVRLAIFEEYDLGWADPTRASCASWSRAATDLPSRTAYSACDVPFDKWDITRPFYRVRAPTNTLACIRARARAAALGGRARAGRGAASRRRSRHAPRHGLGGAASTEGGPTGGAHYLDERTAAQRLSRSRCRAPRRLVMSLLVPAALVPHPWR